MQQGKSWPNLMSVGLRNELRQPLLNKDLYLQTYNWETWYKYMKEGAAAVNTANPNVLIFLSGLNSDTDLSPVVQGTALTPGTAKFAASDFPAKKLVLELHTYDNSATDCAALQDKLFRAGFQALTNGTNVFPVAMTEFGFPQDATTWKGVYASCLEAYIPAQGAGWMIWVLAGSYYTREGIQDYDEGWGLLTHDWSGWRSPEHINGGLVPMVKATLANAKNPVTGTGSPQPAGTNPPGSSSPQTRVFGDGFTAVILLAFLAGVARVI